VKKTEGEKTRVRIGLESGRRILEVAREVEITKLPYPGSCSLSHGVERERERARASKLSRNLSGDF